ncbi:D-ribose pyranase [Arthrobacter sp. MMS18-M83]|uniref:D-ribose pyranase n=1 Tax=Arthrobacter sp. MMS18-M83 TaxID=2996261 RepID=UPI00227D4301|nr:D-ribose pyranase [Arthrobacter sp. MMS18-M83]WAH96333.1 D-ribose pyranase [Arthrobacter sp. MMS18-M83]
MKKNGILNGALNAAISALGHGDLVVVADCGLPIPLGTPTVDLALVQGTPGFLQVLDALRNDVIFEGCTAAAESTVGQAGEWIKDRFPAVEYIPHEELKQLTGTAKLVVRSGEATPYANVILRCGVSF